MAKPEWVFFEDYQVTTVWLRISIRSKKTGEQFTCANAKATNEAADWYAYFPSNDVKLTGQDGTLNVSSHDSGHLVKVIPGQNHLRYYKERLLFLNL